MTRLMLKAGILFLVITSLAKKTYGQFFSGGGARATAMAETSLLLRDEFGLFNNPGGLNTEQTTVLLAYNTRYMAMGINDARAGLVMSLGSIITGFGIHYYGDHLYNQLEISTTGSHQVGFAHLGIRVGYRQFYLENYGYKRAANIDLGGIFTLSEQVSFAMLLTNLTRAKLAGQDDYRLSSLLALGVSYQPLQAFRIDLQISKDINLPVSGSVGIEYRVSPHVSARTGFNFSKALAALGFGFHWNQFSLDLAGNYQPQLGFATCLALVITKKSAD